MTLTAEIKFDLHAEQTDPVDLVSPLAKFDYAKVIEFASGTGLNQADKIWSDTRTIGPSATDSLDLAGGSLEDALGDAATFAKLKAIIVKAVAGNTNNVVMTRPASNGVPWASTAGDAVPIKPGGLFVWVAPDAAAVAVTAGTGDLLDLVNSAGGTSVTCDVILIGTSA